MLKGLKCTPGPWTYQYNPYTSQDGCEIPAWEVHGDEKVCDTNEDRPAEEQEANARMIAATWGLLELLYEGFNITHDWQSSVRKGYIRDWHKRVRETLADLGMQGM
jgi:hypothetical protein